MALTEKQKKDIEKYKKDEEKRRKDTVQRLKDTQGYSKLDKTTGKVTQVKVQKEAVKSKGGSAKPVSPPSASSTSSTDNLETTPNYTPANATPAYQEPNYSSANPETPAVKAESKEIVTPAQTIKTYKDKEKRVVGIEDTVAGESKSAPKGEYYTEESIRAVEQERADITRKEARLQKVSLTQEAKQTALYNEYFNEKGNLKQNLPEKSLSLLGVQSLSNKKVEEYKGKSEALSKQYYDETFSIYTGKDKPEPVKVDVKNIKGVSMASPNAIKSTEVKSLSAWVESGKQLRESGYYGIKNRQQMQVTSVPLSASEKQVLSLGEELERQQQNYINRKTIGTAVKVGTIAVGGTLISKGLEVTGLAAKPLVQAGAKALAVGYAGSVGARGYLDVYRPAKEGNYLDAVEGAFDLGTELYGVKLMGQGAKTKAEYDRPILQREGAGYRFERKGVLDKDRFSGLFKRDVVMKGYVKDTGEIAYTTQVFRKGKVISEMGSSLVPTSTGYKGFEAFKGGKPYQVEYKAEVVAQTGVEKPLLSEGAQRLAQIRTGNKLNQVSKTIETVSVKGKRIDKGFLNKQTPYEREYVSLVAKYESLSAPIETKEYSKVGDSLLAFEGSNLESGLKNAARSTSEFYSRYGIVGKKGQFGSGGRRYSKTVMLEQPVQEVYNTETSGLEPFIIEPGYAPTVLRPLPLSGSNLVSKPKSLSSELSMAKERFVTKQKPLEELNEKQKDKLVQGNRKNNRRRSSLISELEKGSRDEIKPVITPILRPDEEFKPITEPSVIQKPDQDTETKPILKPKEDYVQKPKPKRPDPGDVPPPPVPILVPPPVRFGISPSQTRGRSFSGFTRPTRYQPSLLGIAKGVTAQRTANLSGLEIRGIPAGLKQDKPKSFSFGSAKLTPVKDGISMKFKVMKPKKKKSRETVGQNMIKRLR